MNTRYKHGGGLVNFAFFTAPLAPYMVKIVCWAARLRSFLVTSREAVFTDIQMLAPSERDGIVLRNMLFSAEDSLYNKVILPSYLESFRTSSRGLYRDVMLMSSYEWNFVKQLQDIAIDFIEVHHGSLDKTIYPGQGKYFCDLISTCQFKNITGEGHFSYYFKHNMYQERLTELSEITRRHNTM
eukprot:TRINITY_DN8722_c0_g1_i2.p1 TRINITY_DN8722_c0_g1~~TRINITY_DN8722_c0_g1_i2.p1  ORF type:complete len:184 (-),score=24.80 TRINITY_DN8722_c0_g1_i2:23-574(-)